MEMCPKCKKESLNYIPWLGQLWQCNNCNYRGPVFLELTERALWLLLKKIPQGKVTTYKILADQLQIHPRTVAKLLANNKRPDLYPCYKVINSNGTLGGYSGKGKLRTKRRLLQEDNIEIKRGKIDLKKYLFKF
jgi:O-6-methylguanine DNA methyltransferase